MQVGSGENDFSIRPGKFRPPLPLPPLLLRSSLTRMSHAAVFPCSQDVSPKRNLYANLYVFTSIAHKSMNIPLPRDPVVPSQVRWDWGGCGGSGRAF